MRFRFGEKREYKIYTRLTNGLFTFILCFYLIIQEHNVFANVGNLIFVCILIVFGAITLTAMELVENQEYFDEGDRRRRLIETNRSQLMVILIILVLIFVLFKLF